MTDELLTDRQRYARAHWQYIGISRPRFAEEPMEGQESVWDYPRPPSLVPYTREVEVRVGEQVIARSVRSLRLLETASPPSFYIPFADAAHDVLVPAHDVPSSRCEWKGRAQYWTIVLGDVRLQAVAWSYPEPYLPYDGLRGHFSVFPDQVDCFVDNTKVAAQGGGFYGGWVTPEIVGPWKGAPGTSGW